MEFEIPTGDLANFSITYLRNVRGQARAEYNTLLASAQGHADTVPDEELARLEALREFETNVETEINGRSAREQRLASLNMLEDAPALEEAVVASGTSHVAQTETVTSEEDAAAALAATAQARTAPTIAEIAAASDTTLTASVQDSIGTPVTMSMVASSDVPGFTSGQELQTVEDIAQAFVARTAGYAGMRGGTNYATHGVAVLRRDYPAELTVQMDDRDQGIMERAINDYRLPGGSLLAATRVTPEDVAAGKSLTAAVGWCSPSTTDYSTCLQVTTEGLASFPEVVAARGGVRHNTGIAFNGIWAGGTNFFNYTEAQIISGVTKPCMVVDCPSFVDTRLGVTGLCITGNILQNRAYPEYVATFIRGAMAVSAHQINMLQIAAVVTASTAVDLTASAPFAGDGTVVSQIFAAIDMAIMDIKYNLRLSPNATLEVKLPIWVLAQMRADWSRRNAESNPNMADAAISSWFSVRNAAPDFVYDWQDAFASGGAGLGNATPLTALPTQVVFLVYPTGTWVRLVSDVITLNSVYDSAKLATNQVTQLFTETGWAMAQMCPVSRAYTVNLCPSGETGAQRTSSNTIVC